VATYDIQLPLRDPNAPFASGPAEVPIHLPAAPREPRTATKVLVTGASGFIGSHLAGILSREGCRATCLVRKTSRLARLRGLDVDLRFGDVTDLDTLKTAVAGNQVVYHVAGCNTALRSSHLHQVNEQGVRNIARACAAQTTPPVLVTVSSLAAAGPSRGDRPRTEDEPARPVSKYGRSKLAGERAVAAVADRVPVTIVRPPIVFGEADHQSCQWFRSIARFGVHVMPGLGRTRYSVIHADDLASLLMLAAARGKRLPPDTDPGEGVAEGIYFAAAEEDPTYARLGRLTAVGLGRRALLVPTIPQSVWLAAGATELTAQVLRRPLLLNIDKAREARAGSWVCSARRASEELGYRVGATLGERFRQAAEWYRREGWL